MTEHVAEWHSLEDARRAVDLLRHDAAPCAVRAVADRVDARARGSARGSVLSACRSFAIIAVEAADFPGEPAIDVELELRQALISLAVVAHCAGGPLTA